MGSCCSVSNTAQQPQEGTNNNNNNTSAETNKKTMTTAAATEFPEKLPFTLSEFKSGTSLGMLKSRGSIMESIDKAIAEFEKKASQSAYSRKFCSEEIRIAFDAWVKSVVPKELSDWKKHARNNKKHMEQLDAVLPLQKAPPTLDNSATLQADAENHRKGTLFFLKSCEVITPLTRAIDLLAQAGSAVSTAKDLMEKCNKEEAAKLLKEATSSAPSAAAEAPSSPPEFVGKIIGSIKELLSSLAKKFPGDAGNKAAEWLAEQTPALVCDMLSSCAASLGAAVKIGKNLFKAISAAIDYFKTRELEDGLLSGQPTIVVGAVRDMIKSFALESLAAALKDSLMMGLDALAPGLGAVAAAIETIITFILRAFFYFYEMFKFNNLIKIAKEKFDEELWKKPDEFNDWLTHSLDKLPMLACYVMTLPMCSSFYSFLSMTSKKGGGDTAVTQEVLKKNLELFESVKKRAFQFVKEHPITLKSSNPMVQQSLDVAKGKKVEIK